MCQLSLSTGNIVIADVGEGGGNEREGEYEWGMRGSENGWLGVLWPQESIDLETEAFHPPITGCQV